MTQSSQNQGNDLNHMRLMGALESAKALATICGVEAMERGDTSRYSVYADLGTALDVSSRRASKIKD